MRTPLLIALLTAVAAPGAMADYTNNIMITGYWPPTNEMIRHFSANPDQNPGGWQGGNWEGSGFNIYSFFPEFPGGVGQNPKGNGDFEVDYQDTSEDWWRITAEVKPVAIITFSRGSPGISWEVELRQRNLSNWVGDYQAPFQPTPSPPDGSVPPGTIRPSTLPVYDIVDAVAQDVPGINPFVDETGFGGAFLSEFIAYHGVWYQDLHSSPTDDAWSVAAGHIHVGTDVSVEDGRIAAETSLRVLIDHVRSIIPAPPTLAALAPMMALVRRRRESAH
ncbi:MAG: hypothetical protein H6811_05910 [Phycisphaeraceae bacterium]|nr:hypothetical protein [Phycisphaeraceae bacterium]